MKFAIETTNAAVLEEASGFLLRAAEILATGEEHSTLEAEKLGGPVEEVKQEQAAAVPESDHPTPNVAADGDVPRDLHGVAHDPKWCGSATAKDPFYGKTHKEFPGQWKRRKGVDPKAYNEWYASVVDIKQVQHIDDLPDDTPVDTSQAFGAQQATSPAQEEQSAAELMDTGSFFGWTSGLMSEGKLNQQAIDQAFTTAGVQHMDLFDQSKSPQDIDALLQRVSATIKQMTGVQ